MAKKIMIVDDDPEIIEFLKTLFTDNGYAVCTASDGEVAMDVLKAEKPDLITLDLEMPNEWGPRFFRKYSQQAEYKDIPVIVISGLEGHDQSIRKAVAAIRKPFDPAEVLKHVEQAIGK
ncbi:MAG: DVU0259 family response regulator domain-containing protein [Thermodesulfobacteriota bacterium]